MRTTGFLTLLLLTAGAGAATAEISAQDAFGRLKQLAGEWRGVPVGAGAEAEAEAAEVGEVTHQIVVSAAGRW